MGTEQNRVDTTPYDDRTDSGEIKTDIRRTRSSMDETLDELGERLHPRNLLDDLWEMFRMSGGNSEGMGQKITESASSGYKSIARTIRENPVPAALLGAAAAWMIFDAQSDDEEAYDDAYVDSEEYRAQYAGMVAHGHDRQAYSGRVTDPQVYSGSVSSDGARGNDSDQSGLKDKVKSATKKTKDAVTSAGSAVGDAASSAGSAVTSAASQAKETVADATKTAWDQTRQGGRRLSRRTGRLSRQAKRYAQQRGQSLQSVYETGCDRFCAASDEYPVAVGAGFLALGMLAGLAIPQTRREDRWMGEASDEFMEQAYAKGEEVLDRGKQVASTTASTVLDEAEEAGVGPKSLKEKISRVAEATKEAAKEAAIEASADEGVHPQQLKNKAKDIAQKTQETAKEQAQRHAAEVRH